MSLARLRTLMSGCRRMTPVADYAARKGMSVAEVERWLAPNLNYEPV